MRPVTTKTDAPSAATLTSAQVSLPPPPPPPRQSAKPTMAPLPPPPVMHSKPIKPALKPTLDTQSPSRVSSKPHEAAILLDVKQASSDPSETNFRRTPKEPERLPSTAFRSKSLHVLALRQSHIPIVVITTETANIVAWKNELRLEDMLNGLIQSVTSGSSTPNASTQSASPTLAPFRSVTRSLTLHWDDLQVRFQHASSLDVTLSLEDAQAALQAACQLSPEDGNLEQELNLLEDKVDNLLQQDHDEDVKDIMDVTAARQRSMDQATKDAFGLTSPLTIPWLWRYRQALDEATNGLEHDLIACPPLILYVCSTQEVTNPIETLQNLKSSHYLPSCYHDGRYDPAGVRQEVLVLHDNVDGPQNWDESELRSSLQKAFGPGASVVRVNSIPMETADQLAREETSDVWNGRGRRGNCLSLSDRVALRYYLANLLTSSLLPALERRIATLNGIVSDRKKGVRNVLKSFWRSGKADEEAAVTKSVQVASTVAYRYDTVESQSRLLADTLFLMKDYEAALSTYRLIKDDFKQDKAHVHYASIQEMMALCLYYMDPYTRAREIFSHAENALLGYSRAGQEERSMAWGEKPGRPTMATPSTRLATRLCLVLTATRHVCTGRHLEVADLLASASSSETALGAAVLLEQSSAHYFHARLFRKYAFHMLMSGHMFRAAQQDHHAFRCFVSALYIYRDGRWEELHSHLRSALAAQLFSMGRMALSLQLYAKIVGSTGGGRVSVKSQQKYINHLLEICSEHTKKALVGADRMAASSKFSGAELDAVRKNRLDRIVQVVRYTKSASRVLELPNIDLPLVDDTTVKLITEEASEMHDDPLSIFGQVRRGSEEVWAELALSATAELRAVDISKSKESDEMVSKRVAKIHDADVRAVIAQIDKEKANLTMKERSKRSHSHTEESPTRALKEPITVEFEMTNPLGIPIDLNDLQLVARMTDEDGNRVCTSEDAIKITPLVSSNEKQRWSFNKTAIEYNVADFCRMSLNGRSTEKQRWKSAEEVEPFFVVTKTSLTLEAGAKLTVAARICPLVRGNLEIIGIRCRLFDEVWIFHHFILKGPLLQNTRQNRVNRIRAESLLLKARIEGGMPCLRAELISTLSSSGAPALQGQISRWNLRLSNVGTAAASSVFMKTNMPWVSINLGARRQVDSGDELKSLCVGPTGTLMELPIRGDELNCEGQIQPGEIIEVPIDIRTSGAGRQEFYVLFRYMLADEDGSTTTKHRWLRKMFEVPVYPSLTLAAKVAPSHLTPGESILSVELTNNRSDRPDKLTIRLKKLTLASPLYRLEPIHGQLTKEGDENSEPVLDWQERISLHYRIMASSQVSKTCLLSEYLLSAGSDQDSRSTLTDATTSSSSLDFLCLERTFEAFEETWRSHQKDVARASVVQDREDLHPRSIAQIRRANTGALSDYGAESFAEKLEDKREHPASIARLFSLDKSDQMVHLLCSWTSEDGLVCGQHNIRQLAVRQTLTTKLCPITVTAEYPSHILNDFSNGPASIPVEIMMENTATDGTIDFEFNLLATTDIDFTGLQMFKYCLTKGERVSVSLQALISSTGVHNLQRIRLIVKSNDVSVPYRLSSQWIVHVTGIGIGQ